MSQLTVASGGQSVGVAGQIMSNSEVQEVISAFNEEASAEMAFGWGVCIGAAASGALLPALQADLAKGVVAFGYSHMAGTNGDLGTTGLKPKAGLMLVRKGRVMVQLEGGVTSIVPFSDRGFLRCTADTLKPVGTWGKATDSTKNIDCTKQAVFVSDVLTLADGSKGAILEVDFTNKP